MARTLTKDEKDMVKRAQNWKCAKCGNSIKSSGHIHHKDGDPENDSFRNLMALCKKCHDGITKKQMEKRRRDDRYFFPSLRI